MNKNFQEMFAKAKQEKRGSLIGFATGMDPNYKTSKKILKEMAKHCGAVEVGIPFNTSTSDSATICLLYTSPSPRDRTRSRMPSSA